MIEAIDIILWEDGRKWTPQDRVTMRDAVQKHGRRNMKARRKDLREYREAFEDD